MGKNKGKNKNNTKPQSQQPIVSMVDSNTITIEEKERLIDEGKREKERLIEEGDLTKKSLVDEGEKKRDEIIAKAHLQAEKNKEQIQQNYINEVKAQAKEDAESEKQQILASIQNSEEEMKLKLDEINQQNQDIENKNLDLQSREENLLKNEVKLQQDKQNYKSQVLSDIKKENPDLYEQIASLENTNSQLIQQIKDKDKTIKDNEQEIDDYLSEIDKCNIRKVQVESLQRDIETNKQAYDILLNQYNEIKNTNLQLSSQILKYGDDPSSILKQNEQFDEENKVLKDKLAQYPTLDEISLMRNYKDELENTRDELLKLKEEKIQLDSQLLNLKTYESDLENSRKFIRVLELQREELRSELDDVQNRYEKKRKKVFSMLDDIDNNEIIHNYPKINVTLEQICDNFRNYLASKDKNPLYYSEQSIRTFFAGLACSRLIILQGMSGTGKSSLPKEFENYMGAVTHRVPVQSSWRDRNDLLGFYNDFQKKYKETEFLKALYSSTRDENGIHLIMLDEMNLSRIEYYFADFLSIMEEENMDNWKINLISDEVDGEMPKFINNGDLQVKNNTWFVGTANKDDSTFTITDKVYDRAIVLNLNKREDAFKAPRVSPIKMSNAVFQDLLNRASSSTADKEEIKKIIDDLDNHMQILFDISFGNRISKQINMFVPAYKACGGTLMEAIDIIFESKVLRKLQGLYDESTKKGLQEFLDHLNNNYSKDFSLTKDTMNKMLARM